MPNKTVLLLGLEKWFSLSLMETLPQLGVSSISARPMPFESDLSHECLYSEKTLGDLGWFMTLEKGVLKGKNGLVVSRIEVGLITGSASGRPLKVKALNLGETRKDVVGFLQF